VFFAFFFFFQRLSGATLLVFSNKQDLPGALLAEEIRDVSLLPSGTYIILWVLNESNIKGSRLNLQHITSKFHMCLFL
jgi:signal recognition particle receptor subunit beta